MHATTSRPPIVVTGDGRGVASHAGTRLLADVADATGVSAAFQDAVGHLRRRCSGHGPGRVLANLAVMLADGGEAISDLAVLRDQAGLFGPVASRATAWRVLDGIDGEALGRVRRARAEARERAWLLREQAGRGPPAAKAAERDLPGLVIDLDATLVATHSEKQGTAGNYKGGYGYQWLGSPRVTR